MKKYFAALFVTGLLAFSACTSAQPAVDTAQEEPGADIAENSQSLIRDTLYASYEILEGWALSEIHSTETLRLYHPAHIDPLYQPSYVTLEIFPTGEPAEVYEEIRDEFLEVMEETLIFQGESAEILAHEYFETHFGSAMVTVFSGELEGRFMIRTQYYLLLDDYVAIVTSIDFFDDDVEDTQPMARRIVDTIRFNDLADVPQPTLPPKPFGGEWDDNVYTNEALNFRFELPDGWTPFSRELVAMYFSAQAEQFIEVMAVSDQGEMVQIFTSQDEAGLGVEVFLLDFNSQVGNIGASAEDLIEVEIAGQIYLASINVIENDDGELVVQETFARTLDGSVIKAITFMYSQETQSDVRGFLEEALTH